MEVSILLLIPHRYPHRELLGPHTFYGVVITTRPPTFFLPPKTPASMAHLQCGIQSSTDGLDLQELELQYPSSSSRTPSPPPETHRRPPPQPAPLPRPPSHCEAAQHQAAGNDGAADIVLGSSSDGSSRWVSRHAPYRCATNLLTDRWISVSCRPRVQRDPWCLSDARYGTVYPCRSVPWWRCARTALKASALELMEPQRSAIPQVIPFVVAHGSSGLQATR